MLNISDALFPNVIAMDVYGGQQSPEGMGGKKIIVIIVAVAIVVAAIVGSVVYLTNNSKKPEEPPTTTIDNRTVLNSKLKLPENDTNLQNVTAENNDVVYTYSETPAELNYSVGDYVAGTAGHGYLRKIVDIDREGNRVIVHTENASLTDVIKKGDFHVQGYLTPEGFEPITRSPGEFSISLTHTFYDDRGVAVKVSGDANIEMELSFNCTIEDWHVKYFHFSIENTNTCNIGFEAGATVTLEKEYTLGTYHLPTIVIWIGPVPVVIMPQLDFKVGGNVQLEAKASTSIQIQISTEAGVEFKGGQWTPINDVRKNITYSAPEVDLSAEVKAFALTPELKLMLYGVVGPYADLEPYLRLHASPTETPWWALYAGLEGKCGVKMEIFDHTILDAEFKLFEEEWKLANASGPTSLTAPRNLVASSGDGYVKLSWFPSLENSRSIITNYRIYRGTSKGKETYLTSVNASTTTYNDTSVTNKKIYYYYVTAVNGAGESPPSNEIVATPYNETTVIWIHNVYELQNISRDLSGWYALANDIDATVTRFWNNGSGFVPMGYNNYFKGVLDGRGHKIMGLYINRPSQCCVGLFGWIGGVVENVGLINVNITGKYIVGSFVGSNGGIVSKSYSAGSVMGEGEVGGLVGDNGGGFIFKSYFAGYVTGNYSIGGLVGDNYGIVRSSHYDINRVFINGMHCLTTGGLFTQQYNDWFIHGFYLNISNYSFKFNSSGNHYEIINVEGLKDLLGFADVPTYKFRLDEDIDLSSYPNLYIPYFVGMFDGSNHIISNLHIDIPFEDPIGLFGYNSGTINNVGVTNAYVNGLGDVGALVGQNEGIVNKSYSTGFASGDRDIGGLVGANFGIISNSYSTCDVGGNLSVGGVVGYNDGRVTKSYSTGNVRGSYWVGGLVGDNDGPVSNSYATGDVKGYNNVGGLIGRNGDSSGPYPTISNSYSTGNVRGSYWEGGLVGINWGTVTASFWDVDTSGMSSSSGGVGKTTAEMKNKTTFTSAGWDFIDVWDIVDGVTYPCLRWQEG